MPAVRKSAAPAPPAQRPLVPRDDAKKTGCAWCPLAPFCADFSDVLPGEQFKRDAEKLKAKAKEPHVVSTRCVEEEWSKVDVLFVGDAPGRTEDVEGAPFKGKAGNLLREAVAAIYNGYTVGYTSVVRCRPPRNRDPGKTEIMSCAPRLLEEIATRKPRLIVALGNIPLEFLTGEAGVTALNGRIVKSQHAGMPETDVLVAFNPAYVLRMESQEERERYWSVLNNGVDHMEGKLSQGKRGLGTYYILDDIEQVREMVAKFDADGRHLAVDTETGALDFWRDKYPGLLCVSFSNGDATGYTIPFDHAESPFRIGGEKEDQREELIKLLQYLLTAPHFIRIGQNEKFDRKHLRFRLGFEPAIFNRDTFLSHVVIDERHGTHGLKTLTYQYTSCGGYERELEKYKSAHPECDPEKGGSYANFPGKLLFWYAAVDADMTWHVDGCIRLEPEYADNPRLQVFAEVFLPKLSRALADMEYQGAQVDTEVVRELNKEWTAKLEVLAKRVLDDPKVKEFENVQRAALVAEAEINPRRAKGLLKKADAVAFNPGSATQLRRVLFEHYGLRPTELTDSGHDILKSRWNTAWENSGKKGRRNPLDFNLFIEEAINNKEWDFFTTDGEAMQEYDRAGNPLASAIMEHRAESKLFSAFILPLTDYLDAQKRIHTNFKIGGAQTGRLSSETPNVQQIPSAKGGGILKTPFVSRFGDQGVILNIDYSQIELRVAAAMYREPTMLEAYRNGEDLHTITAKDIVHKMGLVYEDLEPEAKKKWRVGAKRTNFGIIYGAQAPTIKATLKKDGVFITDEESEMMVNAFLEARPGLVAGMKAMEDFLAEHGYVESPTGYRRRIPEVFSENRTLRERALRQGVNFGVQNAAAQMTLMALCIIHSRMEAQNYQSKLILNVHDSLVFDCHVNEFQEIATASKYIMENLPEYSDEVFPGMDWSWLDVPIVAECELGINYGKPAGFDPTKLDGPTEADGPLFGEKKGQTVLLRDARSIDELWEAMAYKVAH